LLFNLQRYVLLDHVESEVSRGGHGHDVVLIVIEVITLQVEVGEFENDVIIFVELKAFFDQGAVLVGVAVGVVHKLFAKLVFILKVIKLLDLYI